jgi:hypothetical protein
MRDDTDDLRSIITTASRDGSASMLQLEQEFGPRSSRVSVTRHSTMFNTWCVFPMHTLHASSTQLVRRCSLELTNADNSTL